MDEHYPLTPDHRAAARPVAHDEPDRNDRRPVRARAGAARDGASGESFAGAQINDGDLVQVQSRRGHIILQAAARPDLMPGVAFIPMHWGARFLGARAGAGSASSPSRRPRSLLRASPSSSTALCAWSARQLPWRLVAFGNSRDAFFADEPARPADGRPPCRMPCARSSAATARACASRSRRGKGAAGKDPGGNRRRLRPGRPRVVRYDDGERGRRILIDGDAVRAVRLSGDTRPEPWLKDLWERAAPAEG